MNLETVQSQVETIVRQSGAILLSHFNTALTRHIKSDGSFATQADLASEKHLITHLAPLVPGAGFYAEESGIVEGNEYKWVIDPLDGTTNFAQGIPYFCVSVALTYNDERIIGAVYQPCTDEFFYAYKGHGATLNGKKLQGTDNKKVEEAMIACDFYYEKENFFCPIVASLDAQGSSLRRFGAAALDIAYCASGRFDAVLHQDLKWWDIAAGSLILEEAGGKAAMLSGKSLDNQARSFLGGSELVFAYLSQLTKAQSRDC